ncbi:MAG: hypothetical protein AAF602_16420 [Myxococcota bacterium]
MARLGIDIGRVLMEPVGEESADTSFLGSRLEDALRTPPAVDAFEVVRELVPRFEEVWLVSKCGPGVQAKSVAWLAHHDFWAQTGIPEGNVRFCRERADKAIHARQLGLTHFIDDRRDVLRHLRGLVPHLFLFGKQEEPPPPWATPLLTGSAARGLVT